MIATGRGRPVLAQSRRALRAGGGVGGIGLALASLGLGAGRLVAVEGERAGEASRAERQPQAVLQGLQRAWRAAEADVYLAERWAGRAEQDEALGVRTLMRAAARSRAVHMAALRRAIEAAQGQVPEELDRKLPAVGTTRENLAVMLQRLGSEKDVLLPASIRELPGQELPEARTAYRYARQSVIELHALAEEARADLPGWRAARRLYVDRTCGYTVTVVDFEKCPVCLSRRETFEEVR